MTVETEVFLVEPARPDPAAIARAAKLVERGGVVAFPTETVYGLGCLPEHEDAVARIYALKGRPAERRLALYVADPDEIAHHAARISDEARRLIERFLPGPLTIVLDGAAGQKTGFRVSPHRVLTALIEAVGRPLVGTSANPSGGPSPKTAAEVLDAFRGRIEAVLDAGPTELGTDSTVVDATASPPVILREGAIAAAEVAAVLGVPVESVRRRSGPLSS
jgi:L-threonylcarbamoyladenylate synthase